jgi:hypothetical protein
MGEKNYSGHQLFVNIKRAYDSVRRNFLYNILIEYGIPVKRERLIKCVRMKPIAESG